MNQWMIVTLGTADVHTEEQNADIGGELVLILDAGLQELTRPFA